MLSIQRIKTMNIKLLTTAAIALVLGAVIGSAGLSFFTPATAADCPMMQMDHSKMGQDMMGGMTMGTPKGDQGEASKAFAKANAAMHSGMDITFTGNADVDFAKGMIPHHQGAIDMAKIELQYGKDPEIRKLAEGVIAAQEGEIKFMTEWLAKNGK
jgi:uncharacterized protein (DUF305 family)